MTCAVTGRSNQPGRDSCGDVAVRALGCGACSLHLPPGPPQPQAKCSCPGDGLGPLQASLAPEIAGRAAASSRAAAARSPEEEQAGHQRSQGPLLQALSHKQL